MNAGSDAFIELYDMRINGAQIISQEVALHVRDRVPTGDDSSLPLYLAVAIIALALMALLRRRAKKA